MDKLGHYLLGAKLFSFELVPEGRPLWWPDPAGQAQEEIGARESAAVEKRIGWLERTWCLMWMDPSNEASRLSIPPKPERRWRTYAAAVNIVEGRKRYEAANA